MLSLAMIGDVFEK